MKQIQQIVGNGSSINHGCGSKSSQISYENVCINFTFFGFYSLIKFEQKNILIITAWQGNKWGAQWLRYMVTDHP